MGWPTQKAIFCVVTVCDLSNVITMASSTNGDGQCRPSSDVISKAAASITATIFLTHHEIPICWVPQCKGAPTLVVGYVYNNKMEQNLVKEFYSAII
jgi:hypothetical protein